MSVIEPIRRTFCCPCRTTRCRIMRATRVLAVIAVIAWNVFMFHNAGLI